MEVIPAAKDTDAEDVVWGLQTAEALWKRGERIDAIVWLRRAAQAAGEAADDDRALELARAAAELTDWMASRPPGGMSEAPPVGDYGPDTAQTYVPPGVGDPDAAGTIDVEVDLGDGRGDLPAFPLPESLRPEPPHGHAPSSPTMQTAQPLFQPHEPEEGERVSVLSAERVHAGMFNPWDENPAVEATEAMRSTRPASQEEVLTSVRPDATKPSEPAAAAKPSEPAVPVAKPSEGSARAAAKPPPLPPRVPAAKPSAPRVPVAPPPLPANTSVAAQPPVASVAASPPIKKSVVAPPPLPSASVAAPPPAPDDDDAPTPLAPPVSDGKLNLEDVEAFADLPDDARAAFAAAASVDRLGEAEEVSNFALAYVLEGAVDVSATMVDASAARLEAGAVLRARGTTDEGVPMRLVCASGTAVVATWTDAAVDEAFRLIPWVEDDLRASADRVMTLVGITIGPLGERLDVSIREMIVAKLTMKPLLAGEIVVKQGETVPGLLLVGVGELELVDENNAVKGKVGSGDFLFAGEVLGFGAAPRTARAGTGGAVILFGDRGVAQELLVTCPPLLEVFAGM